MQNLLSHSFHKVQIKDEKHRIFIVIFRHIPNTHPQNIVNVTSKTMQDFHGQMHLLKTELKDGKKEILRSLCLEQMMNV